MQFCHLKSSKLILKKTKILNLSLNFKLLKAHFLKAIN